MALALHVVLQEGSVREGIASHPGDRRPKLPEAQPGGVPDVGEDESGGRRGIEVGVVVFGKRRRPLVSSREVEEEVVTESERQERIQRTHLLLAEAVNRRRRRQISGREEVRDAESAARRPGGFAALEAPLAPETKTPAEVVGQLALGIDQRVKGRLLARRLLGAVLSAAPSAVRSALRYLVAGARRGSHFSAERVVVGPRPHEAVEPVREVVPQAQVADDTPPLVLVRIQVDRPEGVVAS